MLIVSALAGCGASQEDDQAKLERWGYDVHVVETGKQSSIFRTTIHGCTVDLMFAEDKELWTGFVKSARGGESPVLAVIQPIGTEAEFEKNPQFTAVCP